jgi:5-methylcytosine-specific restriction endonuclease McrA
MKRTRIMPYVLYKVKKNNLEKYGQLTCELCKELIENDLFTYDHIVPISKFETVLTWFGPNSIKNLQITHRKCNEQKSDIYNDTIS